MLQQIRIRAADVGTKLTAREQEVLRLVAEGQSAPDIATRLYIEASTVKTHLQNIYEKLGVSETGGGGRGGNAPRAARVAGAYGAQCRRSTPISSSGRYQPTRRSC